jgi:heme exporter protein D
MMNFIARRCAAYVALAVGLAVLPLPSNAQTSGDSQPTTKAQRKEARREARAKRNAELKRLEAAGYDPARTDDSTYPSDIQAAERKAAAAKSQ